jgi:translation initiation factor 3 subunit K
VDAQATGQGDYFFDANKALLKVYQSLKNGNVHKIATVLLLALVEQYPSTNVLALSYLVPERFAKAEPCASVLHCSRLLDSCQFSEFWDAFAKIPTDNPSIKALVGRSTEKLQHGILSALAFSYKSAQVDKVLAALNLKDAAGITKLNHSCVTSVTGSEVVFAATADNTKRNRVFQEGLSYSSIASLMAKVSAE